MKNTLAEQIDELKELLPQMDSYSFVEIGDKNYSADRIAEALRNVIAYVETHEQDIRSLKPVDTWHAINNIHITKATA